MLGPVERSGQHFGPRYINYVRCRCFSFDSETSIHLNPLQRARDHLAIGMAGDDHATKQSESPGPTSSEPRVSKQGTTVDIGDRNTLVDKAIRFLNDAGVKDAPVSEKRDFLLSKGFSEVEVEDLLENSVVTEQKEVEDCEEDVETGSTTKVGPTSSLSAPVITYPDFLYHTQRPSPPLNVRNLLSAAYMVTGAAATLVCTTKYLVEPMRESLDFARHAFLDNTKENIKNLNGKLEQNVSLVPTKAGDGVEYGEPDQDMSEDDAARYFSKTRATQTSPRVSRSSSPRPPNLIAQEGDTQASTTFNLERLQNTLQSIEEDADGSRSLQTNLEDLRTYLSKLPHFSNPTLAGHASSSWKESANDDVASKLRGEVKSLKGVLLNARNFPSASVR